MSRGRFISKRLGKSEKVADLNSMHARFLYVICYTNVDVEGRCTANPQDIYDDFLGHKMRKKYSPSRIEEYLQDLDDIGLVNRYGAKGKMYMEFIDFHEHQVGLRKNREARSLIPAPPKSHKKKTKLRSNSGVTPEPAKKVKKKIQKKKSPDGDPSPDPPKKKLPEASPEEYLLSADIQNTLLKWNTFAKKHSLAEIMEIEGTRRKHLVARIRMKKNPFIIEAMLEIIEKCPFLLGKTKAGFRVFFDWIVNPSNYQKIIEGNYIDQKFAGYKAWLLKKKKERK